MKEHTRNHTILSKYWIHKWLKIMKISILMLFIGVGVAVANNANSQTLISLNMKSKSLKHVIEAIERNNDYVFLYNDKTIDTNKKVSISVSDANIENVLEQIIDSNSTKYKIEGRQVVLYNTSVEEVRAIASATIRITGKVIDKDGLPLIGVTIAAKGTTNGTVTDVNGVYVIDVKPNTVLIYSYIGFKPSEINVGVKTVIDVTLQDDDTELEEVVVVGMGTQRKASVIGSVSTLSVNELTAPNNTLSASLSGRIAGAVAVQRSGEPGQDHANFWIRGISTFGGNSKPLILVDGVERDMNDLAVEEIESISILKDASATAVYGVRAANGVLLITTRKGVAQKPQISVKLEYGVSDLPRMPKFLDGANYARLYNEAFGRENYTPEYIEKLDNYTDPNDKYLYPNVDWFDEIFKSTSSNLNANINITGGGQHARYFINAGYVQDNGNLRDSQMNDYKSNVKFERYNFRSNLDISLTRSTVVALEIGASLADTHQPGVGGSKELFQYAYLSNPLAAPVYLEGIDESGYAASGWGAPNQIGEWNPAERLLGSGYRKNSRTRVMSQISLNQDLDFLLNGLKFRGAFSFDTYNNLEQIRTRASTTYSPMRVNNDGELVLKEVTTGEDHLYFSSYKRYNRTKETKLQLTYDEVFADIHRVSGMTMFYTRDYIDGDAGTSTNALPYRKLGLAFRATYSFKDRYFAEFNIGYNGSENFPKNNRFGTFPAGALGYLISNEDFWKFKPIDVLKIKGSIGLVGAESLAGRRFAYISQWGNAGPSWNWGMNPGSALQGIAETDIAVSNLTWEKGLKKNIGIEVKALNNSVTLDLDVFHEKRTDILVRRTSTLPESAGFLSAPWANIGKMQNKGIDATLDLNRQIGNVSCRLYGNLTYTQNKILDKDEPHLEHTPWKMETGHRLGQRFGLIAEGLFKDQNDIDNSPVQKLGVYRPGDVKYRDINGDNQITLDDVVPIGYSHTPELVYGFGGQVIYKNFDLGVFFRGQARVSYLLGGTGFIPFYEGVGKGNLFKEAMDRWTVDSPNPNAFYPRLSDGRSSNNWTNSTRNIYDGSFLRFAELEVGYTLKKDALKVLGVKSLRVYFLANNIHQFSKWKMWDPEIGGPDENGIESPNGNRYPLPRKMNFGLKATF